MFLLVKLRIDTGLEAVLPGPQNALYVMLCYGLESGMAQYSMGLGDEVLHWGPWVETKRATREEV